MGVKGKGPDTCKGVSKDLVFEYVGLYSLVRASPVPPSSPPVCSATDQLTLPTRTTGCSFRVSSRSSLRSSQTSTSIWEGMKSVSAAGESANWEGRGREGRVKRRGERGRGGEREVGRGGAGEEGKGGY